MAFFKALKKKSSQFAVIDYGLPQPFPCSRQKLLLLSLKLAIQIRRSSRANRVGIVLPPGLGGIIANLGVFFAGKVPVNLNFSLGPVVTQKLMVRAEIDTIITAQKMMDKFPLFPWTKNVVEISSWLKNLAKKPYLLLGEFFLLLVHVWAIGLTSCVLFIAGSRAQHGGYGAAVGGWRGGGRGVLQDS